MLRSPSFLDLLTAYSLACNSAVISSSNLVLLRMASCATVSARALDLLSAFSLTI